MSFSLCGISFFVSLPFTALLTLFFLMDQTGLATLSVLTVLLHEMAHLLTMRIFGQRPSAIRLVLGAIEIVTPTARLSRRQEICILAAGSAANLLAGSVLYLLFRWMGGGLLQNAAVLQFCFGLFNLLPATGLDGGGILSALCDTSFARLPGLVSAATLLLLTTGGLLLFIRYGGAGVLFAAVYLLLVGLLCTPK